MDDADDREQDMRNLAYLPYELLLHVVQHLDSVKDVNALQQTCQSLYSFAITRPVYRHLAHALLSRCRPLPVDGFTSIINFTREELRAAVNRAALIEHGWTFAAPRPSRLHPFVGPPEKSWYKVLEAPEAHGIDWLSPITPRYNMYATPHGNVYCWDVEHDRCVAQWQPEVKWSLWKCRVEFDMRSVFFVMARVVRGDGDEPGLMEFMTMSLVFPAPPDSSSEDPAPEFRELNKFLTSGYVLNLFLLDPLSRLLAAFIWLPEVKSMGLYVLFDWEQPEYVFVNTGIECTQDALAMSPNWSCILSGDRMVMHVEDTSAVTQYVYTLPTLREHVQSVPSAFSHAPKISTTLAPIFSMRKRLHYLPLPREPTLSAPATSGGAVLTQTESGNLTVTHSPFATDRAASSVHAVHQPAVITLVPDPDAGWVMQITAATPTTPVPPPTPAPVLTHHQVTDQGQALTAMVPSYANPFPPDIWSTESAHFVRQWWPTLPGVPRLSCTVLLLATHDPVTHTNQYTLAQHYFEVPMEDPPKADALRHARKGGGERFDPGEVYECEGGIWVWYLREPFELVCIQDDLGPEEELDVFARTRPLIAVDFCHAAWVEYVDPPPILPEGADPDMPVPEDERKRLRMVTFPPVGHEGEWGGRKEDARGTVKTLEVPDELDLSTVETINLDQSQGSVILSTRGGRIFILNYD
ncbi:hypothetical protein PUNSTDRAFT_121768 [Punctularia strigosozonata HHB-11173 SS5]|uniref:uncharacterized protein n=1 Tax=Punctularia strigosozonata (strain HHB-11173) TaxID=741275 RepID=UPI000441753C|nr:uncharacterized protein PUNSTDRAFT_121768 [Punctularia strigosozonata HHB-11173 SS5]EIN06615.1 hypothetical protein PUNSTDRAFT_121768 [Punctularia strigosozonata HHB-11173 SS5]